MDLIKTRKIRLSPSSRSQMKNIAEQLSTMTGVEKTMVNEKKSDLIITYDLNSIMLKTIEDIIEAQGLELDSSLLSNWKRSWAHFTEQNELDNYHVHPNCCSDPRI